MKYSIHPLYKETTATCCCGNVIKIFSTVKNDISLDVCNKCHPFYTGKQRDITSGGRINRFKKRFSIIPD